MKFKHNQSDIPIDIIINPEHKRIAVMLSGGPDSALLTYLLIKTIQQEQLDTQIFPVTAELLKRPFNIRYSKLVLDRLADITGYDKFGAHLIFEIPAHLCLDDDVKISIMRENTTRFAHEYDLERYYNGQTKNPPPEVELLRQDRMLDRDTPEEDGKKLETKSVSWPLLFTNKRGLSDLYRQHDLLETLFPYTRSCEGETEETNNHTTACERCWWCRERFWGFGTYK